jgi:hypothetical protein
MANIKKFVEYIEENIYKRQLIYRSIIVAKDQKERTIMAIELLNKDYSVLTVESVDYVLDYNNIDNRIVLICSDIFKTFINHLNSQEGGLIQSSYNFIAFSYLLHEDACDDMMFYYINMTKNNANNTIFLDKRYAQIMYLKKLLC